VDEKKMDSRCRSARPERIDIGDDELVRNDIIARDERRSERGLNRGDADGAPYTYVGAVKYRPIKRYQKFLASRIRQAQPLSRHRRGGR